MSKLSQWINKYETNIKVDDSNPTILYKCLKSHHRSIALRHHEIFTKHGFALLTSTIVALIFINYGFLCLVYNLNPVLFYISLTINILQMFNKLLLVRYKMIKPMFLKPDFILYNLYALLIFILMIAVCNKNQIIYIVTRAPGLLLDTIGEDLVFINRCYLMFIYFVASIWMIIVIMLLLFIQADLTPYTISILNHDFDIRILFIDKMLIFAILILRLFVVICTNPDSYTIMFVKSKFKEESIEFH